MKLLSFILAVSTATLAVVCIVQSRNLAKQRTQLTSAREETQERAAEIEKLEEAQKHARAQRDALLHQADVLTAQLMSRPPASAAPAAAVPGSETPSNSVAGQTDSAVADKDAAFGKVLSKMMQDPEMKKFMRVQQRAVVDQLYGPLAKKLNLTSEETDKFKNLIADNMASGAEKATSLFGGDGSTNRTEAIEKMTASQKEFDEQMKSFLGDDRYAQYKDYQETVGERAQLNQFKQQLSGAENALSDQQMDRLLALMKEEKQNAITRGDSIFSDSKDPAKVQEMLAGGQTEKLLQAQENINQHVYDRARDVLTPTQLESFGAYQTNSLQMMRMGISMAKQMFGTGKDTGDAGK
jgi:hypothetical protein